MKNPSHIVPNQLLMIDIPPQYCAAPSEEKATPVLNISKNQIKPLQQQWNTATPKERTMLSQIAPVMLGTGAASLTAIKTSFATNAPQLQTLVKLYEDYKAGQVTKGQYDYRRKKMIKAFEDRMGALKHVINRKKSQRQILRISRRKGRAPTSNITRQMGRMGKITKLAAGGGVLLTAASLSLACSEIANTDNTLQKNHILVESLGSVAGGLVFSGTATITLLIMATPVGWIAALAIGIGSVASSYAGGQVAKKVYNRNFKSKDLTTMPVVSTLCG